MGTILIRSASSGDRQLPVHDRRRRRRRRARRWLARCALQELDVDRQYDHGQRTAADAVLSRGCSGHRLYRRDPGVVDRRVYRCPGGVLLESSRLQGAGSRRMGKCRTQFGARAEAVRRERRHHADVPMGRPTQSRLPHRRDQRAQSRDVQRHLHADQ